MSKETFDKPRTERARAAIDTMTRDIIDHERQRGNTKITEDEARRRARESAERNDRRFQK